MTAVTSHQRLPQLIDEMPPGGAKDLVFHLCGHTGRSAYCDDSNYEYPQQYSVGVTIYIQRLSPV